jgi:hypothetical protein
MTRHQAELAPAYHEVALLQEEMRIKDDRLHRVSLWTQWGWGVARSWKSNTVTAYKPGLSTRCFRRSRRPGCP